MDAQHAATDARLNSAYKFFRNKNDDFTNFQVKDSTVTKRKRLLYPFWLSFFPLLLHILAHLCLLRRKIVYNHRVDLVEPTGVLAVVLKTINKLISRYVILLENILIEVKRVEVFEGVLRISLGIEHSIRDMYIT